MADKIRLEIVTPEKEVFRLVRASKSFQMTTNRAQNF